MRTKRTIITFFTDAVPQIVIMFLGIFKSKIFLNSLDVNVYGLYQLYSQIIGYLTLLESGMTGAVLYRLFKPVAENDTRKINMVVAASKRIFNIIAFLIWGIGLLLVFVIPYLINNNPFKLDYIFVTFVLYISTNAIYYLFASYRILMEASQKKYITNIITQIFAITKSIVEIILVVLGFDLIPVLCVGIITTIAASIIIKYQCKKEHPKLNLKEKKDFSMLKDAKNILIYKFAGLIGNNIDLIIISKFINLYNVVIYSTYNFICNSIRQVASKIYVSVIPSIGQMYVTDREKVEKIFYEYNTFVFFLGNVICVPLLIVINNFIKIWYDSKIPVSSITALAFVINLYYAFVRQPLLTYVEATGLYKKTMICPILEIIINLSLSLFLVNKYGIPGVLIATFAAYFISEFMIKPNLIIKNLFQNSCKKYYQNCLILFMIFLLSMATMNILFSNLVIDSILNWFFISCGIFILNLVFVTFMYKFTRNLDFFRRFIRKRGTN